MLAVSAVPLPFSLAATPQEFFDRVREPVERAVASSGAQLVVLPDYTGWMLLGAVVPNAQDGESFESIAGTGGYGSVAEMLRTAAPVLNDFHLHLFSSLAQHLGIYLVPGSVIESQGTALYNTAYLFGPDGKVLGSQRQTHRTRREIEWGLTQGDTLRVLETGLARIGIVLGADVGYPEVARILALQGANVLIHPAADIPANDAHWLLDLWRDVQANQVFGIQTAGQGVSAVYAPVEMTPRRDGVLAKTADADEGTGISAVLDFDALQRTIDSFPIFDYFNYDLYAREFPGAYGTSPE